MIGVFAFSVVVFIISYRIDKSGNVKRGKLAMYVTLMMWLHFYGVCLLCRVRDKGA
jgi:hypothetical protein